MSRRERGGCPLRAPGQRTRAGPSGWVHARAGASAPSWGRCEGRRPKDPGARSTHGASEQSDVGCCQQCRGCDARPGQGAAARGRLCQALFRRHAAARGELRLRLSAAPAAPRCRGWPNGQGVESGGTRAGRSGWQQQSRDIRGGAVVGHAAQVRSRGRLLDLLHAEATRAFYLSSASETTRSNWDGTRERAIPDGASEVRMELYRRDPSLNQSLISEGTTISQLFDQARAGLLPLSFSSTRLKRALSTKRTQTTPRAGQVGTAPPGRSLREGHQVYPQLDW